jgi:hypothetical protein
LRQLNSLAAGFPTGPADAVDLNPAQQAALARKQQAGRVQGAVADPGIFGGHPQPSGDMVENPPAPLPGSNMLRYNPAVEGLQSLGGHRRPEADPMLKAQTQPELEDQRFWGANLQRNRAFLNPGATAPYNTALPPQQEAQFRAWLTENQVPFNPNLPVSDYDMRGYWSALQAGDPHAKQEVDPNDNRPHFPDYWKTPLSPTFSSDSQWANPEVAPRWEGDNYQLPNGQVLWDDKAQRWVGPNPPWGAPAPPQQPQQPQAPLPRMGGVPTANSLLQQVGDVHLFEKEDEQEKAQEIPPWAVPLWSGAGGGNFVTPWRLQNWPKPPPPGPPANEAALQQAPLLQQAALLRMLLPGGLVGPGGYRPMPGTQDNPLLQPGPEGAVVGSRPIPGTRDRNSFFNQNSTAPYNPPGVPDDRAQDT